jgi:hypothetical protein
MQALFDSEVATHFLVAVPLNTLQNWIEESLKWISNGMSLYNLSVPRTSAARLKLLNDWKGIGGVLLIGHEMIRNLLIRRVISSDFPSPPFFFFFFSYFLSCFLPNSIRELPFPQPTKYEAF